MRGTIRVFSFRAASATLLAALAGSSTACEETSAASAPSTESTEREVPILGGPEAPAGIGAIATAPDYRMTVETVDDCVLPAPFRAARGNKKLAVEVTLEGTSEREVPVNPFYAHIEDAEGRSFEATLAGCKPVLEARRLTRGQKAKGVMTFEIPRSVRRLGLIYAPVIIGGGREELRFDLGL